jgi:hypothetical protein
MLRQPKLRLLILAQSGSVLHIDKSRWCGESLDGTVTTRRNTP